MFQMDPREEYKNLVELKCQEYRWELTDHVKEVMISVLMTRDKVWVGGGGVQSILSNDLRQAINYCDSEIVRHLREMVIARDNFHLKKNEFAF